MILSNSHAFPKYLFSADIQDVNGTRQVANKLQEYLETLEAEGCCQAIRSPVINQFLITGDLYPQSGYKS